MNNYYQEDDISKLLKRDLYAYEYFNCKLNTLSMKMKF